MSNALKKALVIGSSAAMILASVAPFAASAASHAVGTNVVSNGTVYFINCNNQRVPYTSAGAFLSYGFNSWSNVVAASAEDMNLAQAAFAPAMNGSLINDHGTVYLMTNSQKAGFTSAANFTGLGYSFNNVLVGDVSFLSSAALINSSAMAHPSGTLILDAGDHRTVYLMTNSGKMGIPSLSVFNSWGYSFANVVPGNSYDSAIGMSSGIMQTRTAGQLNPSDCGNVVIPPVTGSMSVSAASDMPASGTLVAGQALADLGHFTFFGTGSVTSVSLKRLGVSADSTLNNVYLFDSNGTRLTDAASVSSGSVVNFNNASGLFAVNGSRTIVVKADILTGSQGQTVGVQLASAMSGSTAVSGSPVSGNIFTVASATLATVAFSAPTGAAGTVDPGTDITVWQGTATVGTRDVLMTRLSLRQIGSISSSDIGNFKLYVDGAQVTTAASLDASGYVTFNVSKALLTGARTVKVTADVTGGSTRTVQMSLRGAYDVSLTDTQYNAGVLATFSAIPFGPASFSVSSGSMTVVKASNSQSSNATVGASNQSLGTYTFTAFGEPIKVATLNVGMITNNPTNVTIRNVAIYLNGTQVGSTTNVPAAASFAAGTGTQFTTNFTVNPGTSVTVEIRGDMFDSNTTGGDEIASGSVTSVQAVLVGGGSLSNGTPQVSLTPINVPSQANVLGNTLTIASGSIALAQTSSYGAQTTVSPQTAYKIGSFVLTGNSTEAVNLNTIYVGWTTSSTSAEQTDLSNLYVTYGGTSTTPKGTVVGTTGGTVSTNSNSWSINSTLPVNGTMQFDVYANVASTLSTNAIQATLAVAGTTAQSGKAVYADTTSGNAVLDAGFTGQLITGVANGTVTATVDASTPVSAIVDDNKTVTTAAFKFAAVNDSYTITDLNFIIADASNVVTVNLKDGATVVASKPGAGTVAFNGQNIAVAANATKVLTVELVLGTTGVGAGTSGASIKTSLAATGFTARSSGGVSDLSGNDAGPSIQAAQLDGNAMYVYKAIPTITSMALPTAVLAAGTNTLTRFSMAPNGGTIGWNRIIFSIAKTSAPVLANGAALTLWNADTNTQVAGTADIIDTANAATCLATLLACRVRFVPNVEQQISGATTYVLKANVTGTLVATDYISTSIAAPSVYAANDTYANVALSGSFAATYAGYGTTPSFIWSDVSATGHATTTSDWVNDFQVRFLPLDSQTVTK